MGDDTTQGGPQLRGASGDTFAALLDRLKRRGTSVLVVGDLSADLERALSRRMMGHPDESRYRLLATLRPTDSPADWFPGSVTAADDWVDVVDHSGLARDAVAATDGHSGGTAPSRADDLVGRIDDWVTTVEREVDTSPGDIRVGVSSLDVLHESEGVGAPRTVAERVHRLMRDHQGVAHLYYPRGRSSRIVQQITVWVDVLIEVRTNGGRPEQRWSVQDTVETSWFPLRDDEPHHRVKR